MLDDDECAEGKMSDALILGCAGVAFAALIIVFLIATLVKVWA